MGKEFFLTRKAWKKAILLSDYNIEKSFTLLVALGKEGGALDHSQGKQAQDEEDKIVCAKILLLR